MHEENKGAFCIAACAGITGDVLLAVSNEPTMLITAAAIGVGIISAHYLSRPDPSRPKVESRSDDRRQETIWVRGIPIDF